jgi:hypothetical protein
MRSKRPVIAIGIAFHSAAQKLSEAVDSALAQNVPGHDIQVLVLDSSPSGAARQLLVYPASRSCAQMPALPTPRGTG